MGAYIDWADVSNRYNSIGKDLDSTAVGSDYIPYAEAEINGRLAPKYTAPFSNNNLTVKDLCIDLVYIKAGNISIDETETLMTALNDKIERLLDGDEKMVLADGSVIEQSVGGTIWSTTQDYHPTFGVGAVEDMTVDTDRIEDEEDARK